MKEPASLSHPVDKVAVIDTAIRDLEILAVNDRWFIVRDTQHQFGDDRVATVNIWLSPADLVALRNGIDKALTIQGKPSRRSA